MGPENLSVEDISQLIKLIGYSKFILLVLVFFALANITYMLRSWVNNKSTTKSIRIFEQQTNLLMDIKEALERQYAENISIDQCEVILKTLVDNNTHELTAMTEYIITNNNVEENREDIKIKVREKIDLINKENHNTAGKFKFKRKRLSEFIDCQWSELLYDAILRHVFNTKTEKIRRMKTANHSIKIHTENLKLLTLESLSGY